MRIRKAELVYSNFSSSLESKWEFIPWESRLRAGSGSQEKCLWTLPFDQKFTKNIPATRSRSSVPRTVMGIQLGYLLSSACQLLLAKAHGLRASGSEPSETAKGMTPEEAGTMAPSFIFILLAVLQRVCLCHRFYRPQTAASQWNLATPKLWSNTNLPFYRTSQVFCYSGGKLTTMLSKCTEDSTILRLSLPLMRKAKGVGYSHIYIYILIKNL